VDVREAYYVQPQEMGSQQTAPRLHHYIAAQLAAVLYRLDRLPYSLTLIDETTNQHFVLQVTPTSRPIGDEVFRHPIVSGPTAQPCSCCGGSGMQAQAVSE